MDTHLPDAMQDDPQLVSPPPQFPASSGTSSRPFSIESNISTDGDGRLPQSFPTPEQDAALTVLKDFEEDTVLDWLKLLRSIEHFQVRSGPECLAPEQLGALNTLKDCENGHVLAGLRSKLLSENVLLGRTFGSSRSASKRSTTLSRSTRKSSARSSLRSSLSSSDTSSPYGDSTHHSSPRSSLGQSTLSSLGEVEHTHWCTYGEHTEPLTTCDGWKRHEKEHEIVYICMPNGPIEESGLGPYCALCGIANPTQGHLSEHQLSACTGEVKVTRSRKSNLAKHLTSSHSISDDDATALSEKWRYKPDKKNFACGFCTKLFFSLTDRLNHIDHEHWRQGEDMKSWSTTNLIKGLLQQPGVSDAWQYLLASDPTLPESTFMWDSPAAESLQLKLETGDGGAQELALAAFELGATPFRAPSQSHLAPVAMSAGQQAEFGSYSDNRHVTSSQRALTMDVLSNATFAQRSALASKYPTISPLSNMNTSKMEMCRPESAQQSRPSISRNPDTNRIFSARVTLPQAASFDGFSDAIQQPWSHLMPSTKSLPFNTDLQVSRLSPSQDYPDPIGYSFLDDVPDSDADQRYLPTSLNVSNSELYQHGTLPPDLHHPYNSSMQAISSGHGDSNEQAHYDHPGPGSHQGKPLPALPVQEPDFDFSHI